MLVKSFFVRSLCVMQSFAALFTVLFFRKHCKTVSERNGLSVLSYIIVVFEC